MQYLDAMRESCALNASQTYNAYVTCRQSATDKAERQIMYFRLKCSIEMKSKEACARYKTQRTMRT